MRPREIAVQWRVWVGLIIAIAATGVWWLWNQSLVRQPSMQPVLKQPLVRLAKETGDVVLRERAEYFDPAPLFFPTEWNYGQGLMRESMKRQPGQVFDNIAPQFVFIDHELKLYKAETGSGFGNLAEVAMVGNEAPFAGIGEVDFKPLPLPDRAGFLEIQSLREGKTIIRQPLTGISVAHADFAPLEFLAAVSPAGLIVDPILVTGSGWEDVDTLMRSYLAKSFRIGERFVPGTYRILIGP